MPCYNIWNPENTMRGGNERKMADGALKEEESSMMEVTPQCWYKQRAVKSQSLPSRGLPVEPAQSMHKDP